MKKVLLFLIDSMMPEVLDQCIAEDKAPALKFLVEKGQYISDCVTAFPTMTASVDCSLITGVYPDQHKVPGLVWFDPASKKIVNYLNGFLPVYRIGVEQCATNVLFDLNESHLSKNVKTVHEELEERGLVSGSINVIAHRGKEKHKAALPFLVDVLTSFQLHRTISGPQILSVGTFVKPSIFRPINWSWSHSMPSRFGINDMYAIDVLIEVIRSGKQPDCTCIYLPDNDHKLHVSPDQAVNHLAQVDQQLVRFLDSFETWDEVVEKNVILLISDHGQTKIGRDERHNISLDKLLADLRIYKLGEPVRDDDQLVICNNERMTYLYPLQPDISGEVINRLEADPRIDIIAWKEQGWVNVYNGENRKRLRYKKGGAIRDIYRSAWTIEGEREALDLHFNEEGVLFYANYPDGLARLYGSLYSQETEMIVITAAPGYEFLSEYSPTHLGGGSHGSLHRQDSLIPLVVVGAAHPFKKPARLIDVKDFILQQLAVESVLV
ncbi:alkaline phosphatase family protein [Brevibacillus fulvus]|uniref:AlkP superfamily pyrophosphatase or phosphodiesterase n=1 Tax=Brevibacillus fulvus TaxID=1125967 RepID=A0A939BTU4_9BACL|nr:alkaline phosphatase family protein [Brevibacillus fulvus]MBM7589834.1 putative AlkP superfamily pyrophosphatase or phosphodiesterase [Brevibacillus fulvus]